MIHSNPSIENEIHFESCKSPNEVFCQEISNDSKTWVTKNIKEQERYETWCEIERTYKKLRKIKHKSGSSGNR